MNANSIICPHCHQPISVDEVLSHQIEERISRDYSDRLEKEKERITSETKVEVAKQLSDELVLLKEENRVKSEKLDEARKAELDLRRQKIELEEKEKSFEIDKQRQLDLERQKIIEQTEKRAHEESRLKILEISKQLEDTNKALIDAQRKADQKSQQLQGEVQELDLEDYLTHNYPYDQIESIGKGVRGADIRQIVKTSRGNVCGVILWESKRTKAWQDEWISKLKDDLRAEKADLSVIVTNVLPKEVTSNLGIVGGVTICTPELVGSVAELLRLKLIDVAREKFVAKNQGNKAEALYQYLIGNEFRQQVESLIEVHHEMRGQINRERAAYEKIWKAREAQMHRLLASTAGIWGNIQGIAGQSLPQVKGLDLLEESIEAED